MKKPFEFQLDIELSTTFDSTLLEQLNGLVVDDRLSNTLKPLDLSKWGLHFTSTLCRNVYNGHTTFIHKDHLKSKDSITITFANLFYNLEHLGLAEVKQETIDMPAISSTNEVLTLVLSDELKGALSRLYGERQNLIAHAESVNSFLDKCNFPNA